MFKSRDVSGLTVTEQEMIASLYREARIRDNFDAVELIGKPDDELPQWWLDKRPHALSWLRHWID